MAEIERTTRKLKWWPSNDKDGDQSVCISRSLMERLSGLVWSGQVDVHGPKRTVTHSTFVIAVSMLP